MTVKKFSSMEHISPFSNVFHTQNVFQKWEQEVRPCSYHPMKSAVWRMQKSHCR